ncbi:MAG: hypothetical protein IJ715_00175 [Bacilli bacterium]|nr:hypothetical protein [Bacilli bacterium]
MNNKGFAISGVLYSILILFLVILSLFLFSMQNKKHILDTLKLTTMDSIDGVDRTKMRINAKEVEYTKDGVDVENVKEALDDLYKKVM